MRKKFYLFVGATLAIGQMIAHAATSATVTSLPQGMVTLSASKGTTTYLSLPLSNNAVFSGTVGAVGVNAISVTSTATPFPTSLAAAASPYFVKFLSGNEKGRILLVTANTTRALTLNTADDSSQQVSLLTSGFNVQSGDVFEIFPGDTLATIFGADTTQNPLSLTGAATFAAADTVNVYNPTTSKWLTYYYNTKIGYWLEEGLSTNANNTVLYPYRGLSITRRATSEAVASFILTGRVAEVPVVTKTTGSNAVVYTSTGYAVGMKLSQLNFGANWIKGTTATTADIVSIWNSTSKAFVSYFEMPDSTWRQSGNSTTDQSSTVVPAGTCIAIEQHLKVSGATSYLPLTMPYSLANF
jgi:uncharacterized protein (TIGR02597 family)